MPTATLRSSITAVRAKARKKRQKIKKLGGQCRDTKEVGIYEWKRAEGLRV